MLLFIFFMMACILLVLFSGLANMVFAANGAKQSNKLMMMRVFLQSILVILLFVIYITNI